MKAFASWELKVTTLALRIKELLSSVSSPNEKDMMVDTTTMTPRTSLSMDTDLLLRLTMLLMLHMSRVTTSLTLRKL